MVPDCVKLHALFPISGLAPQLDQAQTSLVLATVQKNLITGEKIAARARLFLGTAHKNHVFRKTLFQGAGSPVRHSFDQGLTHAW